MKKIAKELQDEAMKLTYEWGQASFIYTIPESNNPDLLRVDVWSNFKWKKDGANVIASFFYDRFGTDPCWECDQEYELAE